MADRAVWRQVQLGEISERFNDEGQMLGGLEFIAVVCQIPDDGIEISKRLDRSVLGEQSVFLARSQEIVPLDVRDGLQNRPTKENPGVDAEPGTTVVVSVIEVKVLSDEAQNVRQREPAKQLLVPRIEDIGRAVRLIGEPLENSTGQTCGSPYRIEKARVSLAVKDDHRTVAPPDELKDIGQQPHGRLSRPGRADDVHVLEKEVRVQKDRVALRVALTDEQRALFKRIGAMSQPIDNTFKGCPISSSHEILLLRFKRLVIGVQRWSDQNPQVQQEHDGHNDSRDH